MTGTRRLEQLLWERRDGEIAAPDREWLEAELARDPEAAAMAREIAAVHEALVHTAALEPPVELRDRIRSGVDAARPSRLGWSPGWKWAAGRSRHAQPLAAPSSAPPTWRRGWAYLAAGLVLGIGLTLVVRRGPDLETRDLAGTAGLSVERSVAAQRVTLPEGRGTLGIARRGGDLILSLDWTAPGPAELAMSGGGGLTARSSAPPPGATLGQRADSVWIFQLAGAGSATLEVSPLDPAAPVEFDVRAQGRSLARRSLRLEELQ